MDRPSTTTAPAVLSSSPTTATSRACSSATSRSRRGSSPPSRSPDQTCESSVMFSDVMQHVLNGLVMGAVVALPALGLTLIFSVLGFINFSIAAHMTVGAYAGWLVNSHLHWPLIPALATAFVTSGLIGVVGDRLALVPMRRRSTAHTALMVAIVSIALNLALENALRFGFGSDLYSYDMPIAR